jgi:hypothetical protein
MQFLESADKTVRRGAIAILALTSVVLATLPILAIVSGCSSRTLEAVPFIPPEYYNCSEVNPFVLYDAYYMKNAGYGFSQTMAANLFDGKFFVFKNIEVTAPLFKYLDEDYFWVKEVIKSYCLNAKTLKHYKIGDMIDVVGKNQGVVAGVPGLVFRDCIILPAGSVQLPLSEVGGINVPGY